MTAGRRARRVAASMGLAVVAVMLAACGTATERVPSQLSPSASTSPSPAVRPADAADLASSGKATADPAASEPSPSVAIGQTPVIGPSLTPAAVASPVSHWLDTSVVGHFAEPPAAGLDHAGKFYSDHNYWSFCGAGSARVALEFAGKNPTWVNGKWPLTSYIEPWTSAVGTRSSWKDGQPSDHGRGYMMYLAMQVKPPSFKVPGVETFGMDVGPDGGSVVGAFVAQEVIVLNWEASGHRGERGYFVAQRPYEKEATFRREIEHEVGLDGYPALISVQTAGRWDDNTRWTLPNWEHHSIPHWISVVGYDEANYYYIDTCWRSTNCGYGDPDMTGPHPGTWSVPKATLYQAMITAQGGYIAPTVK